jgi:hypothetical protein
MDFLKMFSDFLVKSKKEQTLECSERTSPKGMPKLIVRDRDGNIVNVIESGNLVVRKGRNSLVRMLTGEYTGRIATIELGEGGVLPGSPFDPIAPQVTDLALVSPFNPKKEGNIAGFAYGAGTDPGEVQFSIIFDSSVVNAIVSEAALKFLDGTLYARYTFPSVYLRADKGYSLEIIWTISFQ